MADIKDRKVIREEEGKEKREKDMKALAVTLDEKMGQIKKAEVEFRARKEAAKNENPALWKKIVTDEAITLLLKYAKEKPDHEIGNLAIKALGSIFKVEV